MRYVPHYYQTSRVYKAVLDAHGARLDDLNILIQEIQDQFFIQTATWGLDFWEHELLGPEFVEPSKPVAHRRTRLIGHLRGYGTITVPTLQLVVLAFEEGYTEITEVFDQYYFILKFVSPRGIPPNLEDVQALVERFKPAHLGVAYQFTYLYWNDLAACPVTWDALDALELPWDDIPAWDPCAV